MTRPQTIALAALMLLTALGGCQDNKKKKTPKEEAVANWNSARASVLGSVARSQYESGNYDKCRQTVGEALRMDPNNAELHVLSAKLCIEQGQLEGAEKELDTVRKLDPKNAEAEYLAGVVCQRWQKFEQACEFYTRACEKNSNELAYVLARGEMLVAMNRSPEALSVLQGKLEFFEHNPVLHHAIGQILASQAKYPQAIESLRQASVLATDDLTIREHLAMAYFFNHQYREAGELYTRILRDDACAKRDELWVALGECQLQCGRTTDARASFETATNLNPASSTAWLSLAKAALQLNDTRRTEAVLRKVVSLDPASSEAHLMLGYVRLKQNKLNEAMAEFQKSSLLDQKDSVSLCMIGYCYEKSGKPQHAMKFYAQALKVKPDDELAARLMASVDVSEQ